MICDCGRSVIDSRYQLAGVAGLLGSRVDEIEPEFCTRDYHVNITGMFETPLA